MRPSRSIYPFSYFDPWGSRLCTCPKKYSLNPYTGCSFMCLYCYAASYIGVKNSTPKKNYLGLLVKALSKIDGRLPINIGTSSDPYPAIESKYRLTRATLDILGKRGLKILITTKGGRLLLRDADLMSRGNVAVTPTITTLDETLARRIEPGAPSPKERMNVIEKLVKKGVPTGLRLDPIIPYLNDDPTAINQILTEAWSRGVRFVVTSTYKAKPLDFARLSKAFPENVERWRRLYYIEGERVEGYRYLSLKLRKKLLLMVTTTAKKLGMQYATCREGLTTPEYFKAPSCDGTHLIPQRIKPSLSK